jgi:hypothetical protein
LVIRIGRPATNDQGPTTNDQRLFFIVLIDPSDDQPEVGVLAAHRVEQALDLVQVMRGDVAADGL